MSTIQKILSPDFSNWEVVAFCMIKKLLVGKSLAFSRSELMSNLDTALRLLKIFGHKKLPKNPEETLQRTIQNLRDKNCILFLGRGEYKLTDKGSEAIRNLKPEVVKAFESQRKS